MAQASAYLAVLATIPLTGMVGLGRTPARYGLLLMTRQAAIP